MEAALCLAANGIKAYRFESLRPTPELSFAVRYLDCVAGINVTASHNPPEYNGYKVYWEDGAQITPPHDQGIMAEVKAITDFADTKTMDMVEAKKKGLLVTIGSEVDDAYMGELKKLILNQDAIDKYGKDIKIVYTPLHGTGNIPVRRILKEIGFENVYVVPEQELPAVPDCIRQGRHTRRVRPQAISMLRSCYEVLGDWLSGSRGYLSFGLSSDFSPSTKPSMA